MSSNARRTRSTHRRSNNSRADSATADAILKTLQASEVFQPTNVADALFGIARGLGRLADALEALTEIERALATQHADKQAS